MFLINFSDHLILTSILFILISQWYLWFNVTDTCSRCFVQLSLLKPRMRLQIKPWIILPCHEHRELQSLDKPLNGRCSFSVFDSIYFKSQFCCWQDTFMIVMGPNGSSALPVPLNSETEWWELLSFWDWKEIHFALDSESP